jgi:hypothetical protein
MTQQQIDLIRRALETLHRLLPDGEARPGVSAPRRCPVALFAKQHLMRDLTIDMTSQELWMFYSEVAAAGEVEPLSKSDFLRRLPGVMEAGFSARKAHNIERGGRRVRGFRGVTIRLDTPAPDVIEVEAQAG